MDDVAWRYDEDLFLNDLRNYLASTYQEHYVFDDDNLQAIDVIFSMGDGESFCRGNALKYLMRHGKKGDEETHKKDILKVVHYCMWLYNRSFEVKDVDDVFTALAEDYGLVSTFSKEVVTDEVKMITPEHFKGNLGED